MGVGGLIERKGPLLALQILHQLSGLGVKAKLTWAGSGPLLEQCREQAAALGVDATFLGQVPAEQIPQLISDSDMFLVPTSGETFFLGAAEAIAAGRPVVTGSYGGHTDFLDPAVCALVSGRDPLVWAQALEQLAARTAAYCAQQVAATLPDAFTAPRWLSVTCRFTKTLLRRVNPLNQGKYRIWTLSTRLFWRVNEQGNFRFPLALVSAGHF